MQVTKLPMRHKDDNPNVVYLVAHLPEDASFWVGNHLTSQTGDMRTFVSPPVQPGQTLHYTVRAQWLEDGKWVSQMHHFPVQAGDVHCVDVVPKDAPTVEKEVEASLAKLEPEDRKEAEEQKFCAVQEGIRLGSMGKPVKVMVEGQPVFLCCEACRNRALSKPAQTLETVKKLKDRGATPPPDKP
jgi:uncharacterized protein (TIGR03000 family)